MKDVRDGADQKELWRLFHQSWRAKENDWEIDAVPSCEGTTRCPSFADLRVLVGRFWKPALEIYKPDVTISNTLNLVFILYSFILVFRSILTPDIYLAFSNWLLSGLFLSKSYDYVWWLMSLTLLSVCVRHWFCCEVSLPLLKNVKLQK